ncbi:ABC transporter permease [uncultured Rossellomorea sp.]|uniref:ABC transporter permease n=1 Tax=uncultured Rossellomorea sp. TaxID=2837549 RepID=UPI00262EDF85|nr:ABC transporter permease subunit [uncultured Rossellomorea sp.]
MKIFWVLLRKEMRELTRNYKMIWMPIVFILFGLTEPLTAFYLPDIINSVGDLPEGTVISIPTPSSGEVLLSTISKFSTFGVLIIVLGFMGMIAGERKSGNAIMVLVKPVSYTAYIYSKWLAAFVLVWVSYGLGMISSWYYIQVLFNGIGFTAFVHGFLVYGLWLTFILTLVVFFSSLVKTPGPAGFFTIGIAIFLTFVSGYMTRTLKWSPGQLPSYVNEIILHSTWPDHLTGTIILTTIFCLAILLISPPIYKKKDLI